MMASNNGSLIIPPILPNSVLSNNPGILTDSQTDFFLNSLHLNHIWTKPCCEHQSTLKKKLSNFSSVDIPEVGIFIDRDKNGNNCKNENNYNDNNRNNNNKTEDSNQISISDDDDEIDTSTVFNNNKSNTYFSEIKTKRIVPKIVQFIDENEANFDSDIEDNNDNNDNEDNDKNIEDIKNDDNCWEKASKLASELCHANNNYNPKKNNNNDDTNIDFDRSANNKNINKNSLLLHPSKSLSLPSPAPQSLPKFLPLSFSSTTDRCSDVISFDDDDLLPQSNKNNNNINNDNNKLSFSSPKGLSLPPPRR